MAGTFVIAQGGGPTAVINQTVVGAVLEVRKKHPGARVLGSRYGVRGIRDGDYVETLTFVSRMVMTLEECAYRIIDPSQPPRQFFQQMNQLIRSAALFLSLSPPTREYFRFFGLDREKLAFAAPNVRVMHPGPMNRGVEIDSIVADGPQSLIREQVEMGVAVRMAVLEALSRNLPNA